jgi:hypothetical protein
VEELDNSIWSSLPEVRRVVGHLLTTGQLPTARTSARSGVDPSGHNRSLS